MTISLDPADFLELYVVDAVRGDRRLAIRTALNLYDHGVPHGDVVVDLLAAAQREVGERWYRNELTVADEHVATGVSAAALDALAAEVNMPEASGLTVVACAEGDWHALAAQMFGDSLRAQGIGVMVLGASTPADYVAEFLTRRGADSLAVSCSLPIFFAGVTALVNAAHREGIPVIAGGRAFGSDRVRASRLGADAWALTAADAAAIVDGWRFQPPPLSREPTLLDPSAIHLAARSAELGHAALEGLAARFPQMAGYDEQQLARTREDMVFIVQFLAAAIVVADDSVFAEFLDWLQILLLERGVPPHALIAGLEALRPVVEAAVAGAVRLLDAGRQQLVDGLH